MMLSKYFNLQKISWSQTVHKQVIFDELEIVVVLLCKNAIYSQTC